MALVEGITGQALQALAATTLRVAGTLAGASIFEGRDLPTAPAMLPAMIVRVVKERCHSFGRNGAYAFNSVFTLVVIGRQVGTSPDAIGADLLTMQEQIKSAFLGTASFNCVIQQVVSIESDIVVTADGRLHTGEIGMAWEIEVFQEYGPNDATNLLDIRGTITTPAGAALTMFDVAFAGIP